jgi:hypothetical protein
MNKWVDVTNTFSEEARYYKNLYMEINEVYDDFIELSLFSSTESDYEIYFSYDIFYGIIYVNATTAHEKREEIKNELEVEYNKNKKVTNDFINDFGAKYDVQLPNDILFDFDIADFLDNMPY